MHIALIPAAFPSHAATFGALAAALAARGHRLSLLQRPEVERWLGSDPPLALEPVAGGAEPIERLLMRAASPSFPFGVRRVVQDMAAATDGLCRTLPRALARLGIEAVVADQLEPAGALAAERAGLPFVSVASGLPLEPEPTLPLPMLGWRYDPSPSGVRRNAGGRRVADIILSRLNAVIAAHTSGRRRCMEACISPLGSFWQLVPGLDFPRHDQPPVSHYLGPLRLPRHEEVALNLPIRGGRPLVYASLGTLQGHRAGLLRRIARACRRVGAELVLSHCGRLTPQAAAGLGADHVVADLPQRAIIGRADLVVCHGGLNTVLDAAQAGRPMLALPIAFDQPGVAARVEWSGAGLMLDHRLAGAGRLARALDRLLAEPDFAAASREIGTQIAASGGARRAALLAEEALSTGRPVLRAAA